MRTSTPHAQHRFDAIGAPWRIDTPEPLPPEVVAAIAERIESFDRTYSRFRTDSLVSRINREPGVWEFPPDAPPLFALYRSLYEATGGAVSPLVGARLENLGYDRSYSLTPNPESVRVPSWDNAVAWDGERLTTVRPVLLDVGAAGKGYLVDLVAAILTEAGVDEYVVDASGDLVHRGSSPLRVALEHPRDPTKAIGVYTLSNAALCASASNRRAWGSGLHHVLDALTGEPTTRVIATWAVVPAAGGPGPAASATLPTTTLPTTTQPTMHAGTLPTQHRSALHTMHADGLATGLFFRGAAAFDFDFQYVRMLADGSVEYSRDIQGEMFT
ncbi:thiamine biosynthesis lipoprotein [Glaciihabitans tibetensis]|uniref:FAD:protein FMN transferase n=1 Tax=Glaciihabitans tibetensis TaxID=1266600 RepID=A0A2T0VBS8_9MICO|nr:FAD:protein FMN transferase [Glaciihabitans tibetensis]PRY67646.1 thiamine biosynthesis lipoprotein [Glaciihabitans tibetensis]